MECPHGYPMQFVKDFGCDECLNDAYDDDDDELTELVTYDDELTELLARGHAAQMEGKGPC